MCSEYFYYEDEEQLVPRIENIMIDTSGGKHRDGRVLCASEFVQSAVRSMEKSAVQPQVSAREH